MRYLVISPVRHNGKSHPAGKVIELDPADAALAVKRGRLRPQSKPSEKVAQGDGGNQAPSGGTAEDPAVNPSSDPKPTKSKNK